MPDGTTAILFSAASVAISIVSLVTTYKQKEKQDVLGARKSLTDIMGAIASTNTEMAKLSAQQPSQSVVLTRRNLNSQRRYLVNHAELLLKDIGNMASDIDHNLLANAFDAIGDYEKADCHWRQCIHKSPALALKSFNLRGYARFLFSRERVEEARAKYAESLAVPLQQSDSTRRNTADTHIFWAMAERDNGSVDEGRRRRDQAIEAAQQIRNMAWRAEMLAYIDQIWKVESDPPVKAPSEQ